MVLKWLKFTMITMLDYNGMWQMIIKWLKYIVQIDENLQSLMCDPYVFI